MKKKLLVVALGLSSSITLIGCGGSDDPVVTASAAPAVAPVSYSVKVIDGYLQNAQVWLDVNGNKLLDLNEPTALSGAGGIATLDVTNIVNPQQYAIYAKIILGQTVDVDRGPVANDYIMSAPPGEADITPLSTLVHIWIEQNTDGTETPEALAMVKEAAIAKVANNFGIPEGDVLSDFIASNSASTAYVAENIVSSKILPDDENEFTLVITNDTDNTATTFNKVVAVVSDRIENIVKATAEEDFAGIEGVFDSVIDSDLADDNDADGVPNAFDDLPDDASDWLDYDGDGVGNIADLDDDDDDVEDSRDADPLDPTVGQFDDCIVNFTEGASSDDFNALLAVCEGLPEMALADNSIIRIQDGKTDTYSFNAGDAAAWHQNGVQHNRMWVINNDGNLTLSTANGETLEYLMRLIDNSTEEMKFAVYSDQNNKIWTTTYKDVDVSVDILACENLASSWDEFKQAVASCQEGKLFNKFSTGFIGQGKTLTTSDALSQAEDVDTYQFNKDSTGTFTYNDGAGAGDISIDTTWTILEDGIIKVVSPIANDYLAIVETNGIDFSVIVFRTTTLDGVEDTTSGDSWSTVLSVPDTD
ncbi:hypothetical protein [Moritella dasanensis]|uniref:hypothetical protein n=1 Tax=Moritella dasanensis TaxID=428031 RepID=UPI0002E36916|nr:hypothetical protein [Moritella dasanensis]